MSIASPRQSRVPAADASPRRAYSGISVWGVPYRKADIDSACVKLEEYYKNVYPDDYMERLLENNERVVSRCGMLMSFSGVLIAVCLFIATTPKALPNPWQQYVFYCTIFIWSLSI